MSELLRKPYKISLWEDKSLYIVENSEGRKETNELPKGESDIIKNHVFKEVKIADIGSNTMDSPIRAFNPKFTQEINGTNTLTFDIFYRYYDEDAEEFRQNPFINLLVNERKIKLNYDGKWYHFVIKEISEDSTKQTFSYTCSDQYINELSKTGYEIVLDTELENNMGTATELGAYILEGSDWSVNKDSSILKEYNEEPLCEYKFETAITATNLETNEKINIEAGKTVLIGYTSASNKSCPSLIFFYNPEGKYPVNSDGLVSGVAQYSWDKDDWNHNIDFSYEYFGEVAVQSHCSIFHPPVNMVCKRWTKNGEEYYSLEYTEFASVTEIQNMLTNSSNFISTNAWTSLYGASTILEEDKIKITFSKLDQSVLNGGFYDNRALLADGLIKNEKFNFIINKTDELSNVTFSIEGEHLEDKEKTIELAFTKIEGSFKIPLIASEIPDFQPNTYFKRTENGYEVLETAPDDWGAEGTDCKYFEDGSTKYALYEATWTKESISYNEFLKYSTNFVIKPTSETATLTISEAKLFKHQTDNRGELIVPDISMVFDSVSKVKKVFFKPDTSVLSANDIAYEEVFYDEDLYECGYEPIFTFEKVRSISGSKSNRFNLIQEICEKFECWARFEIKADEKGCILNEYVKIEAEGGVYKPQVPGKLYYSLVESKEEGHSPDFYYDEVIGDSQKTEEDYYELRSGKQVRFLEYIEEDNPVGFRYGINLKSIQRKIDSKQIVTKTIVQPNSNEYALNGMGTCTIQRASMNPSGETTIYNFNYYIQHGLLNRDELNRDLYGEKGFFNLLYQENKNLTPLTDELADAGKEKTSAGAAYTILNTEIDAAKTEKNECLEELTLALEKVGIKEDANSIVIDSPDEYNDFIKELIVKRDTLDKFIKEHENELKRLEENYRIASVKYEDVLNKLSAIENKKKQYTKAFYQKYSRFLHEGTWVSEDYIDDDLYYVDAVTVARTSAYPKISYTINVVELSQVEGFEPYKFKLADRSYIEDTEFFGYDEHHRPYKEEIIVSKVLYSLDDPSQNVITVQNYKTRFEDLFQRIAATTTSLQYSEGGYNRAAGAFNADGTINDEFLKNSLAKNTGLIMSAPNGELIIDQDKGTITAKSSKGNLILNSLGILIGTGNNYQTAISAEGINASVITTGRLNTGSVYIYGDGQETFRWDKTGINAYSLDTDSSGNIVNAHENSFVRFDRFGLYGYKGESKFIPNSVDEIIGNNNTIFSLTWRGLHLNIQDQETDVITIRDENGDLNFSVDGQGNVVANNLKFEGTLTGNLFSENGAIIGPALGIGFDDNETKVLENANFQVDSGGNVKMKGSIALDGKITFGSQTYGNFQEAVQGVQKDDSGYGPNELRYYYGLTQSETTTTVGSCYIYSPYIIGDHIGVRGTFQTFNNEKEPSGYMGSMYGTDANGSPTDGVAISAYPNLWKGEDSDSGEIAENENIYLIVTTNGIRLQAGTHTLVLTPGNGGTYDGEPLNSGTGGVATFG